MLTPLCVSVCVCRFYEYGLLPGVHFVTVDTAADVPAMVKYLREHDDYARAVALAGRARMAALDTDAVADFMAELLKQYAAKQVRVALSAPLAPTATGLHTQHCTLSSTYLHF